MGCSLHYCIDFYCGKPMGSDLKELSSYPYSNELEIWQFLAPYF